MEELRLKILSANKEAGKLAKEMGFKQWRQRSMKLAGGIESLYADKKPEGFAYTYGSKEPNDFFPKKIKANKEILAKIDALPVVLHGELNNLINYDWRASTSFNKNGGQQICFSTGILFKKNFVLIDWPEYVKYKPVKGMTEITFSEYQTLSKKK